MDVLGGVGLAITAAVRGALPGGLFTSNCVNVLFMRKLLVITILIGSLAGCSMREEMRRIEVAKQAGQAREASRSTNLTGEQLFYRSCNTCHPSGARGMGPALDKVLEHYPEDKQLAAFLRKGNGLMPPLLAEDVNEEELQNIVAYVRTLNKSLNENEKKK